jgi:hypothetical protein
MQDDPETGDGLLNRAELEIEVARFALKLARRVDPGELARVATWIQDEATALIARVQPAHRPWAGERVQQIAWSVAGVEVSVVAAAYGLEVVARGCPKTPRYAGKVEE